MNCRHRMITLAAALIIATGIVHAEYQIGDIVDDFVLPNRLGYDTHLYDYRGDTILIVFYSDG